MPLPIRPLVTVLLLSLGGDAALAAGPALPDLRANIQQMLRQGETTGSEAADTGRAPVPPAEPHAGVPEPGGAETAVAPALPPAEAEQGSAEPLPERIDPGTPDLRASIMRMLEAERDGVASRPGETEKPPVPPEAARKPIPPVDTGPTLLETRPDWFEGEIRMRRVERPEDGHVPVPHKTLTIRSVEDLKALQKELGTSPGHK